MVAKNVVEILQREGVLHKQAFSKFREFQRMRAGNVLDFLSQERIVLSDAVIPMLRDSYRMPVVDLMSEDIDLAVARLLPRELCFEHAVVPYRIDEKTVAVAMADPDRTELTDFIATHLKRQVRVFLAPRGAVLEVLNAAFDASAEDSREQISRLIVRAEQFTGSPEAMAMELPVVSLLNHLIAFALRSNASDLHIEPAVDGVSLRFRIDGLLHEMFKLPNGLLAPIVARVKILSHLRIDEHLRPQDGRFTFTEGGENVAVRVSVVPTLYGPKAALRFLDTDMNRFALASIGLSTDNLATLRRSIGNAHGLILVTGPTGSGKTTTLYALLNELRRGQVNLSTIEDPIEYHIPGVNQIQVNAQVGLTFSDGLRSILRQDPDIIMVGEIRDRETAQIAVNAALTGHLVLSSLHTNSATAAIPRLIDMGVEPYLVASTLRAVVGQRLVRKVCPTCAKPVDPASLPAQLRTKIAAASRGSGCSDCLGTGYRGRTGIYEVMTVDERFHDAIMGRTNAQALERIAVENGMRPISDDGYEKVAAKHTTIEEIIRTTQ